MITLPAWLVPLLMAISAAVTFAVIAGSALYAAAVRLGEDLDDLRDQRDDS